LSSKAESQRRINIIKGVTLYAKEKQENSDKRTILFCGDDDIYISISLDGPKKIHDKNRMLINGNGTYDAFIRNLTMVRDIIGKDHIGALMTTSTTSLSVKEMID
jgi:sulfatase maturation enzyme AslB (radical SAM superfamily)